MSFNQLGLSAELLRAIADKGYRQATPIQQQAIPHILAGRDILAGAQTGTGKTAGFTLPLLQRLQVSRSNGRRVRVLVLTPTRELAAQVGESVRDYGRHLPFRVAEVFGGVSINTQISKLRKGVDIVVATPGRLRELLFHRIGAENWQQVLVFTRTKHGANRLANQLTDDGLEAMAIHGNKSQAARTRALKDFKAGAVRVLVATDIAARGLDIDRLPHVVNYELPNVPEDYLHRIGRTARAGQEGHAVSLVCVDEHELLRNIERLLKCEIEEEIIPGYEPDPRIMAEPIQKRRAQRPAGQHAGARQNGRTGAPNVRGGQRRRSSSRRRRVIG